MTDGYSSAELKRLSNVLIGDQLAKVRLLVTSQQQVLKEIIRFDQDKEMNNLKLDILQLVLNLEQDVRDELGHYFVDVVNKVYQINSLPHGLSTTNDSFTSYKYIRLLNLCLDSCESCHYPHGALLQEGLIRLLRRSLRSAASPTNVDDKRCLVELLSFFLHIGNDHTFQMELLSPLQALLLEIADRYVLEINFKYVIRVKKSRSSFSSVKYNPLSNKGLELNNTIPNAVKMENPMDRELFSLGLALYPRVFGQCFHHRHYNRHRHHVTSLWEEVHFGMIVSSLLRSLDINLKCCALSFLMYPFFHEPNYWQQRQKLRQLLPYLIECFNYDPLPWWFDPFERLNSLIDLYHLHEPLNNPVISFLSKTNVVYGLLTLFSQCLSLKSQNSSSIKILTKFIKLCASFSAFDELYRSLLLEEKPLIHHLENGMENHLNLLKEFLLNKQLIMHLEGKDALALPPLYDSDITMAWLLLLKSFSRSVTALRTSLKRNRLAELLLDLLRTTYRTCQECEFAGNEFLKAEVGIMGITLGGICNFVVEFSYLQSFMLKNGIVNIIGELLTNPLFNSKKDRPSETYPSVFEDICTDEVKTNALWVLRHLMYNCQNSEKLDLLTKIPMSTILEFINDPSWSVQEQCFQLIRNLTCNSRKVVNILLENFKDIEYKNDPKGGPPIAVGTTYLFEYLARKMKLLDPVDVVQKKTLEGILYILVNVAAVNENKKELVIEQDEILDILHEILSECPQRILRYGNDSKLKLASLWVLNNLLWNSTISRYTHYALEGYTPSQDSDSRALIHQNSPFSSNNDVDKAVMDDEDEEEEDQDQEGEETSDTSDNEEEFVHTTSADPASFHANQAAVERCKKLVNMGMYDLVKQNIFDESLSVREKARTLLYHMDLLLKGSL
ncbi:VID28 (YIL017C) [Zygosaccharomyces parabailii]|nr:VID28 (YIL017C) [Zygosaccharomyces parabailii]